MRTAVVVAILESSSCGVALIDGSPRRASPHPAAQSLLLEAKRRRDRPSPRWRRSRKAARAASAPDAAFCSKPCSPNARAGTACRNGHVLERDCVAALTAMEGGVAGRIVRAANGCEDKQGRNAATPLQEHS